MKGKMFLGIVLAAFLMLSATASIALAGIQDGPDPLPTGATGDGDNSIKEFGLSDGSPVKLLDQNIVKGIQDGPDGFPPGRK